MASVPAGNYLDTSTPIQTAHGFLIYYSEFFIHMLSPTPPQLLLAESVLLSERRLLALKCRNHSGQACSEVSGWVMTSFWNILLCLACSQPLGILRATRCHHVWDLWAGETSRLPPESQLHSTPQVAYSCRGHTGVQWP